MFRSLAIGLILTVLTVIVCQCACSEEIEQTYVTRWNIEPIARFEMVKPLTINAVRCRIDDGTFPEWIEGSAVGAVLGKTTWRVPVSSLTPGTYKVTYDLRTPTGAEWIPGTLRVPQIARNTGLVGTNLQAPAKWPSEKYPEIACDRGPVEFAWDRDNLYVRCRTSPIDIVMDMLPVVSGKYVKTLRVAGTTTLSWGDLFPAIPLTGQVIRYHVKGSSEWTDLLFVGTGEKQFFGATIVSDGAGGDDQGPPVSYLKSQMDLCGLDLSGLSVTWEVVEAIDPGQGKHIYDWSKLLRNESLYKGSLVLVNINLQNHWAEPIKSKDPVRYWKLAEDFVYETAKLCATAGVKHFTLGYNEPEMFSRTDNADYFNIHLTHCANAVRKAVPDATVFAGRFSSGDPNLIRQFYAHGFKDNFDVLDIHPYTRDATIGTAEGEVVASHEALAALGMGHKRIFLGEGWGPGRELSYVKRTNWDDPVSPEEADYTRQYYQNGYRCLVTARADYSPDWVIGAKYFTLNDNVGGTYWKQSAKPVYSPNGELMGYMIGELQFAANSDFKARFYNGGLMDFMGKPKGTWLYDFPPALPEVRVIASGRPDYVLLGEWHKVDVTVVNANSRPITDLKLGIRDRSAKFKGHISAEAVSECTLASLAPGEIWRGSVKVCVDKGDARRIRWAFELQYKCNGENHTSDDIVPTEIKEPVDVIPSQARVVIEGAGERTFNVKVRNNQRSKAVLTPVRYDGVDFSVSSSMKRLDLASGKDSTFLVKIKPRKLEPGVKNIELLNGSKDTVAAIVPLECPRTKSTLKLDGDLSDWPREQVARGAIHFGRDTDEVQRPSDDPFPKPPPAKRSAIEDKVQVSVAETESKSKTLTYGANAAVAWDDGGLYLAIMVEDKTHTQRYTGFDVWHEDSVQIAFDPLSNGDSTARLSGNEMKVGYDPDDYEMALALTGAGPQVAIVTSPNGSQNGLIKDAQFAACHHNGFTVYEAHIPWSVIKGIVPVPGTRFGFDILINNLENGKRYTLGWAGGIGNGKYPGLFVPIILK